MPEETVTVGELNRTMSRLMGELAATRAELARVGDLEVSVAVHRARLERADERLDEVEGTLRWVARTVLASLLVAAVALLLSGAPIAA